MKRTCYLDVETVPGDHDSAALHDMAKDKDLVPFAALSPWLCRVVCVGIVVSGSSPESEWKEATRVVGMDDTESELRLLDMTNRSLDMISQLVTFNGCSFDIPVLVNRMVAVGLKPCPLLLTAFRAKPWENGAHLDVLKAVAGNGKWPSLREVCLGYGLPDPKAGGDWSKVAELLAAGELQKIGDYCLGDVRAVRAIHRKLVECGVLA